MSEMLSCLSRPSSYLSAFSIEGGVMFPYFLYFFSSFVNQVLISETMKQNDRQDDEEQLKIHDVRGECFAPHLALILKSEWHKLNSYLVFRCRQLCVACKKASKCVHRIQIDRERRRKSWLVKFRKWCKALSSIFAVSGGPSG